MLRQRSRPYLFSNSIPPMVAAAGIKMVEMMSETNELQDKLHENTAYFTKKMLEAGFDIKPTQSAICAVMLYDAKLSQEMASKLLDEGIYVIGFYYPVVPKGLARIRVQISAAHEREHLDKCVAAFTKVGKELGVLKEKVTAVAVANNTGFNQESTNPTGLFRIFNTTEAAKKQPLFLFPHIQQKRVSCCNFERNSRYE
jgi:glycine cleavage system protein P-like pyridoxal-binding family